MMQRHRIGTLVIATALALVVSPARGADLGTADVGVTMRWVGVGTPRARSGETVTYDIVVTNHGPGTATGVMLGANMTDQFDPVSLTCSIPAGCSYSGTALASGSSFTARLTVIVSGFVRGESRHGNVWATVWSSADADASNDTYAVATRLVGSQER
jgi:uncharacterized repeat protein (TIGR01451 family)